MLTYTCCIQDNTVMVGSIIELSTVLLLTYTCCIQDNNVMVGSIIELSTTVNLYMLYTGQHCYGGLHYSTKYYC